MPKNSCSPRMKRFNKTILVFAFLCPLALAQTAFVRVNQVGYLPTQTKRAYLMSSASETGATFSVKNSSGTTVFSGPIGANLGSWSKTYPNVYALDFDSATSVGTYTITVSGPIAAASPSFKIDTGANVYSSALANSLFYYESERDGPNFIGNSLRTAAAHLKDQTAKAYLTPNYNAGSGRFSGDLTPTGVTLDASGGWWDAGDYLKFVQTTSYTVALMAAGVRDFPNQMGAGSTNSNFTNEVRFGMDWLLKMWDDSSSTFYYQVGIGEGNAQTIADHDLWRLPQADDSFNNCTSQYRYICDRPVFVNTAGGAGALVSPNLAGRMAAAFAICYRLFKATDINYANQCLLSADHIYSHANTAPSGNLLTAIPFSFYPETEWRDDLELGATELYLAMRGVTGLPTGLTHNATFYLQQAAHWANAYITGPGDAADTLNLYDVTGFAHFDLYRALGLAGNAATGLETNQAAVLGDLKKQLDKAVAQGNTDPFGFGFPWNVYDTTSHGGGISVMAAEYTFLTGANTYAANANRWLGNILGANAWGTSLIVGDGTTFPDCMQHQVANLAGTLNGMPPVLLGAAVEGPNSIAAKGTLSGMRTCPVNGVDVFAQFNGKAVYKDFVQSYSTVEPAIDLTASSFLAFSWQVAGAPSGTP
jgi:endoglucanase